MPCCRHAKSSPTPGTLRSVQEEVVQAQRQLQAASGERAAAEQDARREAARAGELHARCLAAEERSAALFAEAAQLRAEVAEKAATLAALQDEGLALGDRARVMHAIGELLQGCASPLQERPCRLVSLLLLMEN